MDRPYDVIGIRFLARAVAGTFAASALTVLGISGSAMGVEASGEESVSGAVWPVDPHEIVAAFDPPGCQYCAGHRGVDLSAFPIAPVRAAISGTITYAGTLAGRGVMVIDDGSRRVTYEPVAAMVGHSASVRAGDVIGALELSGSHCFPDACLHLGLIDDASAEYLDPLTLFANAAPVRLLPLWVDAPMGSGLGRLMALF